MKFKSKIGYLGEKNSLLPRKMTEKLTVEVDVKNPDRVGGVAVHLIYFVCAVRQASQHGAVDRDGRLPTRSHTVLNTRDHASSVTQELRHRNTA